MSTKIAKLSNILVEIIYQFKYYISFVPKTVKTSDTTILLDLCCFSTLIFLENLTLAPPFGFTSVTYPIPLNKGVGGFLSCSGHILELYNLRYPHSLPLKTTKILLTIYPSFSSFCPFSRIHTL